MTHAGKPLPGRRIGRVLLRLMAALLCLALFSAAALWFLFFCRWGLFTGGAPYSFLPQPAQPGPFALSLDGARYICDDAVVNILFIGVDERNAGTDTGTVYTGGYADVLMLCSYNLSAHTATLLPIPRDTTAPLGLPSYPGADTVGMVLEGPVCLAHAYGKDAVQGAQFTSASVSALLFGVPIHRFVSVHMEGIRAITDYVGGVSVRVTNDFSVAANQAAGSDMVLDGAMAEAFVRGRSMGGMTGENLDRMVRQRMFLFALLAQLQARVQADPLWAIGFLRAAMPYLTTDASLRELAHLAADFVLHNGTAQLQVMDGEMVGDVYIPKQDFLRAYLRDYCMVAEEG